MQGRGSGAIAGIQSKRSEYGGPHPVSGREKKGGGGMHLFEVLPLLSQKTRSRF